MTIEEQFEKYLEQQVWWQTRHEVFGAEPWRYEKVANAAFRAGYEAGRRDQRERDVGIVKHHADRLYREINPQSVQQQLEQAHKIQTANSIAAAIERETN